MSTARLLIYSAPGLLVRFFAVRPFRFAFFGGFGIGLIFRMSVTASSNFSG
jgi:hypothetical protein